MMDCKNALVEAKGDMEQAIVILRKKGPRLRPKEGGSGCCRRHDRNTTYTPAKAGAFSSK
jgi:hypothetical protein